MAYATINKGSSYFNTVLYTGTGSGGSNRQITGVGFQPDWVWVKTRGSIQEHVLADVVRGATAALDTSANTAEEITTTRIGSFISDGFQLGSGAVQNRVNENGVGLVAWNWKANGAGVSNTQGSITSTVSANTTSGFSVVTWTGAGASGTVGHGLGAVPKFIITKKRNNTGNWACYHVSLGNTKYIYLNTTGASATYSGFWNNTTPTSTLISLGTDDNVTGNGDSIIAYCFAEVKGFSKFGSYIGNGNANGTFVYTGFKPAFFLGKNSSNASENWFIFDNKRDTFNTAYRQLFPNTSGLEATNTAQNIDILSNGFKMRSVEARFNESGSTMIYMAFAENPFVLTDGTPVTAR